MKISRISAIVFDLGGVLINLDLDLTRQAFARLGFDGTQQWFVAEEQEALISAYEKGQITSAAFRQELQRMHRLQFSDAAFDAAFDAAWNAMLLDFPAQRLEMLARLQQHHRVFVLSNTNEIHLEAVYGILQQQNGLQDLSTLTERVFVSHEMGMRKPDAEIYAEVLQQAGLSAGTTLFFDDNLQNVEAAAALGIRSIHVQQDICAHLQEIEERG